MNEEPKQLNEFARHYKVNVKTIRAKVSEQLQKQEKESKKTDNPKINA